MAAVAMQSDTKERVDLATQIHDNRLSWQAPSGPWQVMLFVCVPDGARELVDYLDPDSVGEFVQLTYEKYYETFPEYFGRTIDSRVLRRTDFSLGGRWSCLDACIQRAFSGKVWAKSGPLLSGTLVRYRP